MCQLPLGRASPHWATPACPLALPRVCSVTHLRGPSAEHLRPTAVMVSLVTSCSPGTLSLTLPLRVRQELRSLVSDPRGRARPEDHAPDTPLCRYDPTKNTSSSTSPISLPLPSLSITAPTGELAPYRTHPSAASCPPAPANQSASGWEEPSFR